MKVENNPTPTEQNRDLDRTRSEQILERFRNREFVSLRKRQVYQCSWKAEASAVFPLLCPTREADWIPGWDAELVFTESGFAEENCVFKTSHATGRADEVWIFTGYELNSYVEFVRFQEDQIVRARISLEEKVSGTTTGTWDILYTGLTESGNQKIAEIDEGDPHRARSMELMVNFYLEHGKSITLEELARFSGRIHGSEH